MTTARRVIDDTRIPHWHRNLTGRVYRGRDGDLSGQDKPGEANTGALAGLRRAASVDDVMLSPAFGELVAMTTEEGVSGATVLALSRTAFILARADRCSYAASFPLAMSQSDRTGGGRPAVSSIRANNLFRLEDAGEACLQIASLMPIVGSRGSVEVNPKEILWAMLNWDRSRRDWANAYHVSVARKAAKTAAE